MLSKLSFGQRLWLGYGILLLIVISISTLSIYCFASIKEQNDNNNKMKGYTEMIAQREIDHLKWVNDLNKIFTDDTVTTVLVQTDDHKCKLGKWLHSPERELAEKELPQLTPKIQELDIHHSKLHKSAISIEKCCCNDSVDYNTAKTILKSETLPALKSVQAVLKSASDYINDTAQEASTKAANKISMIKNNIIFITIAVLITGISFAYMISKSTSSILRKTINELSDTSAEVAEISHQVSTSAQELANGSTNQASNLEETTSSIDQINEMTKDNTKTTSEAAKLSGHLKESVKLGNDKMKDLSLAINKIQQSSDETSKILKVIDEIAFQTNLLALNAAVEAARAGEAGKGFAVVAEEVRNLAMRSAQAARNTSNLIEESINNALNGVSINEQVENSLSEINEGIDETSRLIHEIADSGIEQASGISHINTAVAEIGNITQNNATFAEESASAAEQLNCHSQSMKTIVANLAKFVG